MASNAFFWEQQLLNIANAALEDRKPVEPLSADHKQLEAAYQHCAKITQHHSRTFYLASQLLAPNERKAVQALYAFCRISDDLVDCTTSNQEAQFLEWRQRSLMGYQTDDDPVLLAWTHTRAKYHIPLKYAEQLLDGVAQDLVVNRYETFDQLVHYCYAVASTVGLMTMHIVGYASREAIPYAIKLGVALQMTNILRDVGEDWGNGRLYLPDAELASFGLTEDDIAHQCCDHRWQAFMRFQIDRTRRLYAEAMPGIAMLGHQGRFAITAAAELYQAILQAIEANNYDVFNYRAHTSARRKLSMMPGIWWRAKLNTPMPTTNQKS